jgi:hypothetical protein
MSKKGQITQCPICGTSYDAESRVWYYSCPGCGSGINLIGIWWKEKTDQNWSDIDSETKRSIGEDFFQREQKEVDWSKVVIVV